jgi:S1-C subfamily serine protease
MMKVNNLTLHPSNSGGALLDEAGNVIGIAAMGYTTDNIPTGLNFFIPIEEAVNVLHLRE